MESFVSHFSYLLLNLCLEFTIYLNLNQFIFWLCSLITSEETYKSKPGSNASGIKDFSIFINKYLWAAILYSAN